MSAGAESIAVDPGDAQTTFVTIIASNSWVGFAFGVSMQPLFDMINSL